MKDFLDQVMWLHHVLEVDKMSFRQAFDGLFCHFDSVVEFFLREFDLKFVGVTVDSFGGGGEPSTVLIVLRG